jgi:hypothetical protein
MTEIIEYIMLPIFAAVAIYRPVGFQDSWDKFFKMLFIGWA